MVDYDLDQGRANAGLEKISHLRARIATAAFGATFMGLKLFQEVLVIVGGLPYSDRERRESIDPI